MTTCRFKIYLKTKLDSWEPPVGGFSFIATLDCKLPIVALSVRTEENLNHNPQHYVPVNPVNGFAKGF